MDIKLTSVRAGRTEILKRINIKITDGDSVAILGRNGSGKSTLLNSITGHPSYTAESTVIQMAEPVFLGFQKPVEVPEITTINFLLYLDNTYGLKSKDKAELFSNYKSIMDQLEITELMLEQPLNKNVSGGENKRIELFQMYIIKPKTILLDEIDTGLDLDMLIIVGDFLEKYIAQNKATVVVVTHNLSFLKYFKIDKVIVLDKGEVIRTEKASFIKQLQDKGFAKSLDLDKT